MSKPGKVLRTLCKRLGVRLTVKRGKKRVYKSVAVLKRQCANKKKKKKKVIKKRRRKFGKTSLSKIIEKRRAARKGKYLVPSKKFFYDEPRVKDSKRYLLERQRLRKEQDFVALKKLKERRRKQHIIRNRYTKMYNKIPVNVKKGFSKEVKDVNPDSFKYEVEGSKPGSKYSIDLLHMACTCGDFRFRRSDKSKEDPSRLCKHIDQIFRQKGISQQQWCEHVGKEGSVDPVVMNMLLGLSTFGRKKRKSRKKVKKEKISASLKKLCKKHKVRLTVKRGKKRVYKSVKVLKEQCQRKVKRKRRRKFGSVAEMLPVNFRDVQLGSEYTVIYKEEMVRLNQVRGPRKRTGIVTGFYPIDQPPREFIVFDFGDGILTSVFPREIYRIEKVKVDFSFLPGGVNSEIRDYL